MKLPFIVSSLTEDEAQVFKKHFAKENVFNFEGIWFRDQKEINKEHSSWKNKKDKRRRIIHFYDTYELVGQNLVMSEVYLYLSHRLRKDEIYKYLNKIKNILDKKTKKTDNKYIMNDLEIIIEHYDVHPNDKFIEDYETVDITIKSLNKDSEELYKRLWDLSIKGIREKDIRENPRYINSLSEIKEYLPAQIELGCGPSIEAGIPALHYLHEVYKVQSHGDALFYFGEDDDLLINLLSEPEAKYQEFSHMIKSCIKAKPTYFHKEIKKSYEKGIFVGDLLNNNFDRLLARLGIKEKILRVYDINTYFPMINFDSRAKSLICIGTHADRRKVQEKARKVGLKIIHIDCEGFYQDGKFTEYKLEGPKDEDLILKITANDFAKLLDKNFHNKSKY